MPNIAQQDYLRIEVADFKNPTASEIALIKKSVEQGTIFDALIVSENQTSKVIGANLGGYIFIIDTANMEISSILYDE